MTKSRQSADFAAGGPQVAGKNAIINGGFDIWQRGTSSGTNGVQTADRWFCVVGGTTTWSQDTSVPTELVSQYSLKWTTGASSSFGQLFQALESALVKSIRGQSMVFSIYIKTTGTAFSGLYKLKAYYSNSSDSYNSQTTAVTITGGQSITPSGTWTRYSGTLTIPSDAVGIKIGVEPDTVQASGVVVYHAGVQLEIGQSATPFSRAGGTIQGELANCQRYYYRVVAGGANGSFGIGQAVAGTGGYLTIPYPVTMRTAPSTLEQTGTASNYAVFNASSSLIACSAVPSLLSGYSGANNGFVNFSVASGLTAGNACVFYANSSATAYLGFSAEL